VGQHRIGVRVNLSPAAERRFLQACKVQGGQTRFIEEAIEHYVHQLDVMEKLNSIENLLRQLVESGKIVSPGSSSTQPKAQDVSSEAAETKEANENQQGDAQKQPDILDPSQLEAAVSTLRALMGGEDV